MWWGFPDETPIKYFAVTTYPQNGYLFGLLKQPLLYKTPRGEALERLLEHQARRRNFESRLQLTHNRIAKTPPPSTTQCFRTKSQRFQIQLSFFFKLVSFNLRRRLMREATLQSSQRLDVIIGIVHICHIMPFTLIMHEA